MDSRTLAHTLSNAVNLDLTLSFTDAVTFVEITRLLKPTLERVQASYQCSPPQTLPSNVHDFLMACLGLSDDTAKKAWALHDFAFVFWLRGTLVNTEGTHWGMTLQAEMEFSDGRVIKPWGRSTWDGHSGSVVVYSMRNLYTTCHK